MISGALIFGMLGFFSFGVGMRESGERFLFLWVSATPPARPTSATPPAIAGPLAFSRTVPTFDLLCAGLDLLCAGLERRLEVCDDRLWAGLRDRELEPVFLVEPVERLLVVDLLEPPLRLRCELAFAELLFEPVAFLAPDDELFALDDERDLLPVLVCAIARPPSRLGSPSPPGT